MNGLLQQPLSAGYPADFLLARLRGKRQHLSADRKDNWEQLLADYRWIYVAMPRSMRKAFAPCFLLVELRSLQMILRFFEGQNRPQIERLLAHSLLHRKLLKAIRRCEETGELLEILDGWFGSVLAGGESLVVTYSRGGHRQVETVLVDALLSALSARRQTPEIAAVVADQVDLRNLLTAARYLRWQLDEPPLLTGGGGISQQLRETTGRGGLERIIQKVAGGAVTDFALLEFEMVSRLARKYKMLARDPLGAGLVIDYLWRRYQAFVRSGLNAWAGADVGSWGAAL